MEESLAEAHHLESLACTTQLSAVEKEEPCGAPRAQQSTEKRILKRKTIKGRCATLHGQCCLKLGDGEPGCGGPAEETGLLRRRKRGRWENVRVEVVNPFFAQRC